MDSRTRPGGRPLQQTMFQLGVEGPGRSQSHPNVLRPVPTGGGAENDPTHTTVRAQAREKPTVRHCYVQHNPTQREAQRLLRECTQRGAAGEGWYQRRTAARSRWRHAPGMATQRGLQPVLHMHAPRLRRCLIPAVRDEWLYRRAAAPLR